MAAARDRDIAAAPSPRTWQIPPLLTLARLRLGSGLWLLIYAATHLANHALGLVSLRTAEEGRLVFLAFWRLPPVEASLLTALLVHVAAALWSLWQRRSWRIGFGDTFQLVLGLLIPFYLTAHVLSTGWLHRCCGIEDSYSYVLGRSWPHGAGALAIMALLVWVHGTIGLHCWWRLRPAYRRLQPWLLMVATLLPVLALAGMVSAGREMAARRALDPAGWNALAVAQRWPSDAERAFWVEGPAEWIVRGFAVVVAALALAWMIRWVWLRRRNIRLTYPGGRAFSVARGATILEASRLGGIPHASVCGGHGRCSTCRVRIGKGRERLAPPSAEERRVLRRIGAAPDVRLACQTRLVADLAVTPLMPASTTTTGVLSPMLPSLGVERDVAVLFADLRGFTSLSEGRLPYDTVFILNRYFTAMGGAIERAGGVVDKFIGDGIMALFGVDGTPEQAARASLAAARDMATALDEVSRELQVELDEPLRMGMGLHQGPVILGEMGHGRATSLTAIGDTVNIASRLETLTKELGCQLVVSGAVVRRAGIELDAQPQRYVDVRGRAGRLAVHLVDDAATLPLPWLGESSPHPRWNRTVLGLSRLRGRRLRRS